MNGRHCDAKNLEGRFGRAFVGDQEIEQVDPVRLLAPDVPHRATVPLGGGQGDTVFLVDNLDAAVDGDLGDQFLSRERREDRT